LARIIGDLGSEKVLIGELVNLGIRSLQSLDDVENHIINSDSRIVALTEAERINIYNEIDELKLKHKRLVSDKIRERTEHLSQLTAERDLLRNKANERNKQTYNPIKFVMQKYQAWKSTRRLSILEERFDEEVERPFIKIANLIFNLEKSIEHLKGNIEDEVLKRLQPHISEKLKIDKALERVANWLIGARGERKVLLSLRALPDSFIIINDVNIHLKPPLKSAKGLRFSCQADHIVVCHAGVFNIETKYWSQNSIQNLDLRSPIDQIKLTGKGLWRELNRAISNRQIEVGGHHWGDTSVPVRNILAMVGATPNTDFQFVKVLPLDRLPGYLAYFEPVLKDEEVENIASWLHSVKLSA